jgi:hypothetical protein
MTAESDIASTSTDVRAVKDRLTHLSALVHAADHVPESVRSALIRSLDELSAAFTKVEQTVLADRERILRATESLTHLAINPSPSQPHIIHGLTSLTDAVHAMINREPYLEEVVGRIAIALNEIGI